MSVFGRGRVVAFVLPALMLPPAGAADRPAADAPSLVDSLRKAQVRGRYSMLLRQIEVPEDRAKFGDFREAGPRELHEYAEYNELPEGYWVYAAPFWYIWRDRADVPKPNRRWGPEQVCGPPDTPMPGDIITAWASATPDGQDEWLLLEYPEPVVPVAVHVYETYNPGALNRVTLFKLDGEEVEVWKGKDPLPQGSGMGVAKVPAKARFKTQRLRIFLESSKVPGYNEIDAVGLVDASGKVHWATACEASSTFGVAQTRPAPAPLAKPDETKVRIQKLEEELRELRDTVRQLQEELKKKK
jgi:hypothetical protein